MRTWAGVGGAALITLVAVGFVLGGYFDVTGASAVPWLSQLMQLPRPWRLVVELVVVVPVAFGVALYALVETVDLLWFISSPIRKVAAVARR